MPDLGPHTELSIAGTFFSSAFAACFAEFCTLPLDTAKVRLQLQKKAAAGEDDALPYRGMFGTMVTIAREEGLSALWKGIIPGLHRQFLYGGLRIGLYDPFKLFFASSLLFGDVPLFQKILAALATGAIAILVANPTDLVKVRLQAEGKLPPGVPKRYSGALDAYLTIIRQEGLWALWTGIGPNIARNAIINAAELASYDHVKETILAIPGFTDDFFTHMLAGLGAGFFAVCIGSPVDVVKSRMMGDSTYKSTVDCFIKTLKSEVVWYYTECLHASGFVFLPPFVFLYRILDLIYVVIQGFLDSYALFGTYILQGPLAFYKGFLPNFGRLGSWNVIMFLTLEKVKKIFQRQI